jgi:CubicO group peptidase (beta-lactamase class C family)
MLSRAFFLLVLPAALLVAQTDTARRVDDVWERLNKPDSPGASLAVVRNGEIVYQKGFGLAHLEYDVPIKADTIFHVASVSKQFTAMAIVLLEQDGKLSIDDDVRSI